MAEQVTLERGNQVNSLGNATKSSMTIRDAQAVTKKLETGWAGIVQERDGDFASSLNKNVDNLFENITRALKQATETSPTSRATAVLAIEDFLFEGDGEKKHIDHCILWLLLYYAVEMKPERSEATGEADLTVCSMIIKKHPYLAFDNPHNSPLSIEESADYMSIKSRCPIRTQKWKTQRQKNSELHFQDKVKTTPFHHAAEHGKFAIIKLMKESLASINQAHHGLIYKVVQGPDPGRLKKTALQYAAEADYGSVETLGVLLSFSCLTNSNQLDAIFASAVRDGTENVVDAFLDQEELKERFVKSKHILTAIERLSEVSLDKRQSYMKIIRKLVELAIPAEPLADEVIESIIEQQSTVEQQLTVEREEQHESGSTDKLNWMDIWRVARARPKGVLGDITSKLLHLAVYYQSFSFVTECLEHPEYSKAATAQQCLPKSNKRSGPSAIEEHFPLWYNSKLWNDRNSKWSDRDGSTRIRTLLVSSAIRQTNKMQKLSEIFYKSGQPVRELCFDISRFNSKLYRVSEFVYSLVNHSESENLLSYEETIRYAEFPALDLKGDDRETFGDNNYLPVQHTEVFDILSWLRDQKGVKRIVELKVPDRLVNPHDEGRIAKYVEMFEVEYLDWRCLDISLSGLGSQAARDNIKELHLYSSGRRAAIDHWLGSDGIPTLTKLEKLHIHVVRETVTEEYCEKVISLINNGLVTMLQKYGVQPKWTLNHGTVNSIFWNPTHRLVDLDEIAYRVTPRLAKFLESLGRFVADKEGDKQKIRRTRVAIIDNGILSITPRSYGGRRNKDSSEDGASIKSPGAKEDLNISSAKEKGTTGIEDDQKYENSGRKSLWSRIKTGRSFVDDGSKVYPWLFASDSHGTQMANLICAMDPFCELYIARVAEGKYGITPDRAARAIEWALEEDVDIISMSIALLDAGKSGNLRHWVNKANEKGVIIVCSTHDEGTQTLKSYPSEWDTDLIVVTACDEYGRVLRDSVGKKYQYMVQGKNVAAGVIPFVESSDYITGSSVSTAITAGLSSLILTCHKLSRLHEGETGTKEDFTYARGKLDKVTEHLDKMAINKHVVLEKFGNIDSTTKEGDEIFADKILRDSFNMPSL